MTDAERVYWKDIRCEYESDVDPKTFNYVCPKCGKGGTAWWDKYPRLKYVPVFPCPINSKVCQYLNDREKCGSWQPMCIIVRAMKEIVSDAEKETGTKIPVKVEVTNDPAKAVEWMRDD